MLGTWMYFWGWDGADVPVNPGNVAPPVPDADPTGWGARGNDYHPLPDDYWTDRAQLIREDTPKDIFTDSVPVVRAPPNPAMLAAIATLSAQRQQMADSLMSLPTVEHVKAGAKEIAAIDAQISALKSGSYLQ